jgi:hypothetical protein
MDWAFFGHQAFREAINREIETQDVEEIKIPNTNVLFQ